MKRLGDVALADWRDGSAQILPPTTPAIGNTTPARRQRRVPSDKRLIFEAQYTLRRGGSPSQRVTYSVSTTGVIVSQGS